MNKPAPPVPPADYAQLATIAGQAGCVTALVVIVALVAGLWLDRQLQSRFIVTLVLLLLSVPVSVVLMIRTVLHGMERYHAARGHQLQPGGENALGGVWRTPGAQGDGDDKDGGGRSS